MSETDFPATAEITLGNGYSWKVSVTDSEARSMISRLAAWVMDQDAAFQLEVLQPAPDDPREIF
jgi:hypothetical protein